jgi:uncharacterized lipoprotein NlpE involved in copper resistance
MSKNFFLSVVLVMALVFGIVGCDNDPSDGSGDNNGGNGGGVDTWSDVTSLSQINGSWKTSSSYSVTVEDRTYTYTYNNYIITINATAKTMSVSGSITTTISGINEEGWSSLKTALETVNAQQGITVTFNDANHSYTQTYNNYSQTLTDEYFSLFGFQINQNGAKLKMRPKGSIETILTKV